MVGKTTEKNAQEENGKFPIACYVTVLWGGNGATFTL